MQAMSSLSLLRPSQRPAPPKRGRRPKTISASTGVKQHREIGTEFLSFVTVPAASTFGSLLYQLEVNPMALPRLSVFASQYKQWKGDVSFVVESLGNAFSTSSVSIAYVPDPDPNDIPTDPTALLRMINSAPFQKNLHLQSQGSASVLAPWKLSTNPWKFVQDTDPSDRANGLFLVASNGSPGTADIPLKVSVRYNVTFQGNTYTPLENALANVSQVVYGVNNSFSDMIFTAATGAANWVLSGSGNVILTLTYPSGTVSNKYVGNWTSQVAGLPYTANMFVLAFAPLATTAANISRSTLVGLTVSATQTVYTFNSSISAPPGTAAGNFAIYPRSSGQ